MRALRVEQLVAGDNGTIHRDLYRWLSAIGLAVVPPNGVITASLTSSQVAAGFDSTGLGLSGAPYDGWAICNGNNGTPNLSDRFIRIKSTGSGATGGSDSSAHTHTVDPASFTSGAEAAHTHSVVHDHPITQSNVSSNDGAVQAGAGTNVALAAHFHDVNIAEITVTSAAGSSHTHAVDVPSTTSSAASATENRPAYYELVALMRLEVA